ncbi:MULTISPECIES: carbon storage regulator CsrA [Cohnella]|jgi:carbon storage regulator|uniref:carbon storage regulator CsrA n=1 Tax=Cohnella TaxID=329857 RepID=UPI000362D745|nr:MULTISPECIES: carbon storage regulator CsrA [Cohnella]REK66468.1 MAG: carbon storage regulator [Cohnella sp.]
MLVLKRKVGEIVKLGDQIEVQVLAVEGETVKLGFTAPANVQILRKELYESIRQENMLAGQPAVQGQQLIHFLEKFDKFNKKD